MVTRDDHNDFRRISATRHTAHVAGDYALSAGFGSTASISSVATGSTDQRFKITITSAGTGQGASPTCTLTFKEPWAVAPFVVASRSAGDQATIQFTAVATTTTVTLTFTGTPVAAETYTVTGLVIG